MGCFPYSTAIPYQKWTHFQHPLSSNEVIASKNRLNNVDIPSDNVELAIWKGTSQKWLGGLSLICGASQHCWLMVQDQLFSPISAHFVLQETSQHVYVMESRAGINSIDQLRHLRKRITKPSAQLLHEPWTLSSWDAHWRVNPPQKFTATPQMCYHRMITRRCAFWSMRFQDIQIFFTPYGTCIVPATFSLYRFLRAQCTSCTCQRCATRLEAWHGSTNAATIH